MPLSAPRFWQSKNPVALGLYPLTLLFTLITSVRRWCYQQGVFSRYRAPIPVIVVGNLSAGGAGKTPLTIALALYMHKRGLRVGLICGGYGGRNRGAEPQWVTADSDPALVGDEPVLIAMRTGLPVVVCKDRSAAAQTLVESCDVLLCDDGLQHYALQRDMEIVVIDSSTLLGNEMLMPSGPLREGKSRLKSVDLVCYSGEARTQPGYQLHATGAVNLQTGKESALSSFAGQTVHAVAAIAYPDKFFTLLRNYQIRLIEHRFADHHLFSSSELQFGDNLPIIMTEKDKVKCARFSIENSWHVPVTAIVDTQFMDEFDQQLQRVLAGVQNT